jgi:hypothetical protein
VVNTAHKIIQPLYGKTGRVPDLCSTAFTYDLGSQGVEMLCHDHIPFDPGELGDDAEPQDLAKRPKRDHELLIVS